MPLILIKIVTKLLILFKYNNQKYTTCFWFVEKRPSGQVLDGLFLINTIFSVYTKTLPR